MKAEVHGHIPIKLYLKNSAIFGPGAICCLSHCNMEMMNPGLRPLLFSLSRAHLSSTETLWTLSPHSAVTCCLGIKAPLRGPCLSSKSFYFRPFWGVGHAHYMIAAELGEGGCGKFSSSIFSLQVWFKKKKKKASPAFYRASLFLWRAPGWRPDKQSSHTGRQSLCDVNGWVISALRGKKETFNLQENHQERPPLRSLHVCPRR